VFQVGVDGFILSQSADLLHPSNESLINSCAYSYGRSLEDLAFCLVYSDRILKYGSLRPPVDKNGYGAPHLLAEIEDNERGLLGEFVVDRDIHGDQLLADPDHRAQINRELRTLEQCVISEYQPRYKEWLVREASIYFGRDESVFADKTDPSEYIYETTVRYHTDRELQDSIEDGVISILDSALPSTPRNENRVYSRKSRTEFITRNMLTLVTIMRAFDLAAGRNSLWRMPHITRACMGLQQVKHQADLRLIVVCHALNRALLDTHESRPESIVRNLCDLRNEEGPKRIRELLNDRDLLILSVDKGKEEKARNLIREIKQAAEVPNFEPDPVLFNRRRALRDLRDTKPGKYEKELVRVFPLLRTNRDSKHFFFPPS